MQNDHNIDYDIMDAFMGRTQSVLLNEHFIYIHGEYFVGVSIMMTNSFEEALAARKDKPYYIPLKEELLKYADSEYFEVNDEYEELLKFLKKIFWRKSKALEVSLDIQGYCRSNKGTENLSFILAKNIRFKNNKQNHELIGLIKSLANNTRVQQHNGHTPNELMEIGSAIYFRRT